MKKAKLFAFIFIVIFFFSDLYSQPIDTIRMKIDSIANAYLSNPQNAGLIIGVYRKRTNPNIPVPPEIYSYGEVRKGTGIRPDSLTLFKLGSVGKTFTATVLAYYLVHQPNLVKLSNPINNYFPPGQPLPFWDTTVAPDDTVRITLFDLATHHSSLPDQPRNFVSAPNYTVARLLEFLGSDLPSYGVRPLPFEPGSTWLYSNTGFGTLGVVLDTFARMPYDSLLIKVFCDSLNMPDTRINLNANQLSRLAVGYDNGDSVQFGLPTSPGFYGAGGNYSTIRDMIKYLSWNMRFTNSSLNNLLDTLHKERITDGGPNSWVGLAWQMNYLRQGHPLKYIWKDGETTGYSSFVCWVDTTKTGVVVLSNSGNVVDPVGINVLRVLNPLPSVGIKNISTEVPAKYSLSQNYPNPFNPVTKIRFDIPSNVRGQMSNVRLIIYDVLGKEIKTLVNESADGGLNAGSYEVEFNGENLNSGIYFYKLEVNGFSETKKMTLLK